MNRALKLVVAALLSVAPHVSYALDCGFSMLRTWSQEVQGYQQKIEADLRFINWTSIEVSKAQQDISKSAFLSSQVIDDAYSRLAINSQMLSNARSELRNHQLCLAEAQKNVEEH